MNSLDDSKYDRQIRTFGLDANNKLKDGSVYINADIKYIEYAKEIVKNLSLCGINKIYLNNDLYILKDYINLLNDSIHVFNNQLDKIHEYEYDCVIYINKMIDNNQNDYNYKSLIYLFVGGFAGSIITKVKNHSVYDTTGENKDMVAIKEIKSNYKLICNKHNYSYGDYIEFVHIEGENLNLSGEYKIIDTTPFSITLENFNIPVDSKFINGYIKYVPKETIINNDDVEYDDLTKELISKAINDDNHNDNQNDNQNDISNQIKNTFHLIIPQVVSIFGGLVANEAIKLITNKFIPINMFSWSDFDIISDYSSKEIVDKQMKYIYDKLNNSNILMIGCGALGCEWLKNIAMIGCKSLTVVDPDHIEKSNLSRQFLFHTADVGKSKCLTAIENIKHMVNPINAIGYNKKLSNEDEDFTHMVFMDKDIVISALDNIEARKYTDSICFNKCLPLFESGTMGLKGNTQPIIPYLTEIYSSSTDSNTDESIPACTIKHFPNSINHTIHWALDCFAGLKNKNPKELFNELFIDNINELLKAYPKDHKVDDKDFWSNGKKCPQILDIYSHEAIEFIEATKLINFPTEFDKENDNHVNWITRASNCRAKNYNIPPATFYETKGIAGKIIPAVATTTSTIVGLIGLELLKYINNKVIDKYRSYFINMAINMFIYSEPNKMADIEINNIKINGWTKFNYNKDKTLQEFINHCNETFKLPITLIISGSNILYSTDFGDYKDNLNKVLLDLIEINTSLTVFSDDTILPNFIIL